MSRVDDVMLMAYVDGEVDAQTAREIETALTGDPALVLRVQQLRDGAMMARGAFAEVLHEPVPDRLIAALGGPAAAPARADLGGGNVVPLKRNTSWLPRRSAIACRREASMLPANA